MGTARKFSKVLHSELDVHAAWLPVTNTFALGDYGVVSDGVFVKMGNIAEYGVTFTPATGAPTKLRFRSDGTRVTKFLAGAEVPNIPQVDLEASIRIEFSTKDSFYVDAPVLTVESMQDVAEVGAALRKAEGWRRKYRVVSSTYAAQGCTIISSREANTAFELNATANVLHLLELGQAQGGITLSGERAAGLEVIGASGVVGLRLFKLRRLTGSTDVLRSDSFDIDYETEGDLEDDV
ncbi:hypothetical protein Aab01nite_72930 [Paractinoplanes abujensis]|uniref:Uncharacterized protein n=1 Tax=Paractinoplanes abujensis TaxID=882441 RepID=A0A7W7CXT6_9ACTN|nr:hypothetical protein [Actinoplanes abujensis]MBB4694971.1 hypothetical protein [Actinoplanes abujensis]GID23703.1 hypothetical protein Aab01nite_72930 [Actinoplanes abujensis]